MKRHTSLTLVTVVVCCCAAATAQGVRDSVQANREQIAGLHPDSEAVQSLQRRVEQGELDAMNSLAIRYARGSASSADIQPISTPPGASIESGNYAFFKVHYGLSTILM